jgi:hypothetical protein
VQTTDGGSGGLGGGWAGHLSASDQ